MSLATLALGLIPGGGIIAIGLSIAKWGASTVFGKIGGAARGAAGVAAEVNWAKALPVLLGVAALVYIAILRGEVQHRDKLIEAHVTWESIVVGVVSKEVGKPVPKDDVPEQIAAAYANAKTMLRAVERQNATSRASDQHATARDTAAKAAVEPTSAQTAREAERRAVTDPKRSGGLSGAEWGGL